MYFNGYKSIGASKMDIFSKVKEFERLVDNFGRGHKKEAKSLLGDLTAVKNTFAVAAKFDAKLAQQAGPTMEGGYSEDAGLKGGYSGAPPTAGKAPLSSVPKDVQAALYSLTGVKSWHGQEPDGVWGNLTTQAIEKFKSMYPAGTFKNNDQLFQTIREQAHSQVNKSQTHRPGLVDVVAPKAEAPQSAGTERPIAPI